MDRKSSRASATYKAMADAAKEGVLEWQKKGTIGGKKWKVVYIVITPGGLHIFKDANDLFPSKSFSLESASAEPGDKSKSFSFGVKTGDGTLVFSGENEAEVSSWVETLKQASGQKITYPPKKTQRGKESMLFRAKKNISGKVATSSLMKQKVLNEETRHLLDSLVAVVEKVTDAKTAANVEKQLIKMVLKGYFQYEKGNITMQEIRGIDAVLRKAFNQVDKMFAYYQVRPASTLMEGFTRTAGLLQESANSVTTLLEPLVRAENLTKMKEALAVITNAEFLFKVWDCPPLEPDLLALISAMNKYTQIELA